jgi:hypothetical protein
MGVGAGTSIYSCLVSHQDHHLPLRNCSIHHKWPASCQGGRQYVGLSPSCVTVGPQPRQLGGAESEVPADSERLARDMAKKRQ